MPNANSSSSTNDVFDEIMNTENNEDETGLQPVQRPVNIEEDVTSLGQKKRVTSILRSPDFKEELETVVTELLRSDRGGSHVIAQAIANVFSPSNRSGPRGIGCVSPINDLTGADTLLYSKGEKLLRCKLAALYRIVDLYGWTSAIFNHITVRVSQEHEHFLINPFGLLYHEVSAAKLIKVNMQGDVIDPGSTTLGFNLAGFILHSAIHSARPDLHCVIHVHTSDVIAVSCMECGLLPISQEALIVGDVSYHTYHGILVDSKEKKAIQKHLGPNNKVMFLRNHGLVSCGETVEEAFHYLFHTMKACNIQVKAMSCVKPEKLIQLDRSLLRQRTEEVARQDITKGKEDSPQWGVGEMMFEAHIRMLDDMGYRSGYLYRNPVIVQHKPRLKSDVQLPATVVGHTPILPEDLEGMRDQLRHHEHSHWVNSPHQYTRIEGSQDAHQSATSSQNGEASPKSRTKWKRADDNAKSSTVVHITNPNQFVPTNTDPREVLELRKSIRGRGKYEYNRPGPQSQLLHNVSPPTSSGIHSSSKAIIEKDNPVQLVTPAGPPNPFNLMSDDGLKQYQTKVLGKEEQENKAVNDETSPGTSLDIPDPEATKTFADSNTEKRKEAADEPKSETFNSAPSSPMVAQNVAAPVENVNLLSSPASSSSGRKADDVDIKSKGDAPKSSSSNNKKTDDVGKNSKVDAPKSPPQNVTDDNKHNDGGKKKKKRPLSFLKKKK